MEAVSVAPWSWNLLWSGHLISEVWTGFWISNDCLQSVVHQRIEVHVAQIHNNLECHEVDDAMGNCGLESKHKQVQALADDCKRDLSESKKIRDLVTTFDEELWVLISDFHDVETL